MPTTHYLFTLNNYTTEEVLAMRNGTLPNISYLCYAQEVAPSTGTPHLQGYFQLSRRSMVSTIKNWEGFARVHLERAKGSDEENYIYCKGPYTKEGKNKPLNDTFFERGVRERMGKVMQGKRSDLEGLKRAIDNGETYDEICDAHFEHAAKYHRFIKERIQARDSGLVLTSLREEYATASLHPWQRDLENLINEPPHPRKISWIWEVTGNVGKSWMAKYLATNHGAIVMTSGKRTDMAYIFTMSPKKDIVIFDLSRTGAPTEGREHFLDGAYSLAEDIKNGMVTNMKYESQMVLTKGSHVIFFANFSPDLSKWSADRYDVTQLDAD